MWFWWTGAVTVSASLTATSAITQLKIACNPFAKGFRSADSENRHTAPCQTESAGLCLPWSVFEESSSECEDQTQTQRCSSAHGVALQTFDGGSHYYSALPVGPEHSPLILALHSKHTVSGHLKVCFIYAHQNNINNNSNHNHNIQNGQVI